MAYGKISDKQKEILEFMKQEILNKGYPPTVRDICEAVNLKSTSSVHAHLETLEKNGYIHRDPTKPRAIEIIDDNFNLTRREVVNVPMIGHVAAGEPILAVENIESYFPIPAEFMPNEQSFILKVKGESMINAGICDGDSVLVKQCNTAKNGDMVAPGQVLIAPGGSEHMSIVKVGDNYKVVLKKGEKVNGHCPSVDVLFNSVADAAGTHAIGIILTGMGGDGAKGLLKMQKNGARTIGQDEASCIVYGMPKVAYDLGAVMYQEKLSDIAKKTYTLLNQR